ncbi:MAG: hypothetical protein AB1730_28620 [Myxococcota bacterium]
MRRGAREQLGHRIPARRVAAAVSKASGLAGERGGGARTGVGLEEMTTVVRAAVTVGMAFSGDGV